jgi:outer membrane protein OmpA-like peptidoglycan-associated protein
MQKATFCLIALLVSTIVSAQNLVGNKGFEERNLCFEYGKLCAPEAWFFVPAYSKMSPVEPDSNHYEILQMGYALRPYSVGNYMYTKLFCPLLPGAEYTIKMKVNTSGFEFDYIDVWTGESEPWRGRYTLSSFIPTFKITNDSLNGTNLKSLKMVSYTFKASGGERFLMLGNISQDPLLNARKKARKSQIIEYGIDEVELYAVDTSIHKCKEYEAIRDQVYRNDFRHPSRFIDDIEIDTALIEKPEPVVVTPPVVVIPKPDTLIIPDVLFRFDKSNLNPKFVTRLDNIVTIIKNKLFTKLLVTGHTDNYGNDKYNLKLSQDRANTIRSYLIQNLGISEEKIEAIGYGETQPKTTNTTTAGRQQNRRVEIIIYH